jgi:hypothetical protein
MPARSVSNMSSLEYEGAKKLPKVDDEKDSMAKRETLEIVRAYYRITDPAVRKRLAELTKAVAKTG